MNTLTRGERFERFYPQLLVAVAFVLIGMVVVPPTLKACKIMDDLANEQARATQS